MRDLHTLLTVLLPQMDFLFPERILAIYQRANPCRNQEVNDVTAGGIQIMHDAPIALRRDHLKETGGLALAAGTGQAALLIVELVHGFQWATIDELWNESNFIRSKHRKHIHPDIDCNKQRRIDRCFARRTGVATVRSEC